MFWIFLEVFLSSVFGGIRFFAAISAYAVKIGNMPRDLPVKIDAGNIFYGINILHLQIDYAAAFFTDKMVVWESLCVKMIHTIPHIQFSDFTEIRQKLKVPVYRTEADIRKGFPDIHIDHICRGVILPVHKTVFDHFPLPAVFQCHVVSLIK